MEISFFEKIDIVKLFNGLDLCGGWVYATTYGIGVNVPLNYRLKDIDTLIQKRLNEYNVIFTTQHSEKKRVFRYLLSKSKLNVSRIKVGVMCNKAT